MKLLVVSDSHSERDCLIHLKEKYENTVDAMIHCGDSELEADDPAIQGFHTVRGNCDFGGGFPNDWVGEVDGYRIFTTHGHLYNIKMTLMNLRYRARELNADFAFFGHSHELGVDMLDDTIILSRKHFLTKRTHPCQNIRSYRFNTRRHSSSIHGPGRQRTNGPNPNLPINEA